MSNDDDVDWAAFAALSADPEIEPAEAMAGSMRDDTGRKPMPAWIVTAATIIGIAVGLLVVYLLSM